MEVLRLIVVELFNSMLAAHVLCTLYAVFNYILQPTEVNSDVISGTFVRHIILDTLSNLVISSFIVPELFDSKSSAMAFLMRASL